VKKGSQAALTAAAVVMAAEALKQLQRKAAAFGLFSDDAELAASTTLALAAAPGNALREGCLARRELGETERRNKQFEAHALE
jgi:hypothetical protein